MVCEHVPVTTIVGVVLGLVGELLGFVTIIDLPHLRSYFKENVGDVDIFERSTGQDILLYLIHVFIVLLLLTIVLIACAGAKSPDKEWKKKLSGVVPSLVILILTFLAVLLFDVGAGLYTLQISNGDVDKARCDEYFKNPRPTSCVVVSFIKDKEKSELCVRSNINSFCKDFLPKLSNLNVMLALHNAFVFVGLLICLVAVCFNYLIARFQKVMDPEEVCHRRY